MSLSIEHSGTNHSLDIISFDKSSSCFVLRSSTLKIEHEFTLNVSMNFDEVLPAYQTIDSIKEEIHLFQNQHYTQHKIIELRTSEREGDGKIGYFFSKNSLFDRDINRFENEKYLTTAAFRACVALVKGETNFKTGIPQLEDLVDLNLFSFYGDFETILCLSNDFISSVQNFDFKKQYLAGLRNYGFNYVNNSDRNCIQNSSGIVKNRFDNIEKNENDILILRTSPISLSVQENVYFTSLLTDLLSLNSYHPLTKFHLLYQVVEVLIDQILKKEIKSQVLDKLEDFTSYKLKTKLTEIASESKRINILLNNYSVVKSEIKDALVLKIKGFVQIFELEEEIDNLDLESLIYKLRNGLVHNYRATYNETLSIAENESEWKELMDLFEILIIDLLSSYDRKEIVYPQAGANL